MLNFYMPRTDPNVDKNTSENHVAGRGDRRTKMSKHFGLVYEVLVFYRFLIIKNSKIPSENENASL